MLGVNLGSLNLTPLKISNCAPFPGGDISHASGGAGRNSTLLILLSETSFRDLPDE